MKYFDIKNKFNNFPVISSSHLYSLSDNPQIIKNQISYWCKKGLIIKLRRGLYTLNNEDRKVNLSRSFIACQLRFPSYISNQYALAHYNLIPERVTDITSITTRKTATYRNNFGYFIYQHIKPNCFTGFSEFRDENNLIYYLAEPEKALVDYFYFNLFSISVNDQSIFSDSFRINRNVDIQISKIEIFTELFKNKKLNQVLENFTIFWRS